MTWLKIDDGVRTHPKVVQAGPAAAWQWFCGNCYCRQHLTDGFIPDGMLASLVPGVNEREARKLAGVLVKVNLWHLTDGGYQVHDFLDWNPTKAEVLAKRADDLKRKRGKHADSIEIPSGKITDSALTRAGGSHSHSPSPSSQSSSLSSSGNRQTEKPIINRRDSQQWDRKHGYHVSGFCDWVCLDPEQVREFAAKVPGENVEEKSKQVIDWAREIRRRWADQIVPDGSHFEFWRNRWTETHGGSRPANATLRAAKAANDIDEAFR